MTTPGRCVIGVVALCLIALPANAGGKDGDDFPLPQFARARLGTLRFRMNLRYGSGFATLAFSPNGKTLVATCDKGLAMWDAATGKPIKDAPASKSLIIAAAFRPDGKTLITFAKAADRPRDFRKETRLIQHWQIADAALQRQFEIERTRGAGSSTEFPRLSLDGEFLFHTNGDEVFVWKALSGEVHARIKENVNHWDPIALTRDGKVLAAVRQLGRINENEMILYDLPAARQRCRIFQEGYSHFAPTFAPDGKSIVSAAGDSLCIWDTANGKLAREIPKVRGVVAFSADGKHLACGSRDGIHLFTWPDCTLVRRFEAMPGGLYVYALAFSPDGKRLASGHDQVVAVWDVASGKQTPPIDGHQAAVCALSFSSDGQKLASGSDGDGTACIWDLTKRQVTTRLTGHARAAASIAFSSDGRTLATGDGSPTYQTGGGETHIRIWDLPSAKLLRKFPGHLNGVTSLDFAPDGKTLASGGLDARVRLWNIADGARLAQVRGGDGLHSAQFSRDGKLLLISDSSGGLSLWQPDMKQKIRDLVDDPDTSVNIAALNASATRVLAATSTRGRGVVNALHQWETTTGKSGPTASIDGKSTMGRPCALSPDGRLLATTTMAANDEVVVRDTDSGAVLARLPTGSWYITALAFSPDGGTIASGSLDSTIILWDVKKATQNPK